MDSGENLSFDSFMYGLRQDSGVGLKPGCGLSNDDDRDWRQHVEHVKGNV